MKFKCPHCGKPFDVSDPYDVAGDSNCPLCGKGIYVEVDEGDEGPLFTIFKEMPSSKLYPPSENN